MHIKENVSTSVSASWVFGIKHFVSKVCMAATSYTVLIFVTYYQWMFRLSMMPVSGETGYKLFYESIKPFLTCLLCRCQVTIRRPLLLDVSLLFVVDLLFLDGSMWLNSPAEGVMSFLHPSTGT